MPDLSTVSIALATYNGGAHLGTQLDSYFVQERLPDELVLSDDGSTDGTLEIAREFAERAPFPVRVISNRRAKGFRGNFATAIESAEGELIALSDQDDVWLPAHLARLAETLEGEPSVLAVASDSECVDNELQPLGYTIRDSERLSATLRKATMRRGRDQFGLVLRHRAVAGHGMAFRRSLVPAVLPFPDEWFHDQWIFLVGAALGRVDYVPDTLSKYRQHDSQSIAAEMKSVVTWAAQMQGQASSAGQAETGRWTELLRRISEHGASAETTATLREKIDFLEFRASVREMPAPARTARTTANLLRGRYHRLGRGFYAYARDLRG
jgi:glycosyltransferase involved in cell wall biosynthesis